MKQLRRNISDLLMLPSTRLLKQMGNNNNVFQIRAICADWPENSHFVFDILISPRF
jgi:hypothetical protein